MDKRYQIFVSSTYTDLKEERKRVFQTLMEMDCIPAGMELFPAADEEQWEFIKKVIDDCDYYLLVIGGRYGSITNEGISYTEKEFDYATEKGLKVVALIHGDPDNIPFSKTENNPELQKKLTSFKDKVTTGRLVKFWKTENEISGLVALSLVKTIKMYPAIGWVRANHVANEDILSDINKLRKENVKLQKHIDKLNIQKQPLVDDIADIESMFTIDGSYDVGHLRNTNTYTFSSTISWRELFSLIAPYLIADEATHNIKKKIARNLFEREGQLKKGKSNININDQQFQTIQIQLQAYGLIESKQYNESSLIYLSLTEKGKQLMFESRVVKESKS